MDLNEIKQILDLVREHELAEFEIEHDGLRLKVRKDTNGAHAVNPSALMVAPVIAPAAAEGAPAAVPLQASPGALPAAADAAADAEIELAVVRSPIVGTFYRSSEPSSPSFVDIGWPVK